MAPALWGCLVEGGLLSATDWRVVTRQQSAQAPFYVRSK